MTKELNIQGLRAIAVISVILFHANKLWLPGGFIGVDIFFVISGYLIASILSRKKASNDRGLLSFYIGRVRRIVPAYLFMLALVTFACYYLMVYSADFTNLVDSLFHALIFNSAHYFGRFGGYFSQAAYELPFQHTWTLAIEMQFYLLLPFVMLFFSNRFNKILLPTVCISLLIWSEYALRTNDGDGQAIYFSVSARIPEFLIGTIVAIYGIGRQFDAKTRNFISVIGMTMIAVSLGAINETTTFPGLWSLLPCVGTALIIASQGGLFTPLLGSDAMVKIGDMSYSLYLWHWPILALARYIKMEYALPSAWLIALLIIIAILAWLSFIIVEAPFRRVGNKLLIAAFIPATIAPTFVAAHLKDWQLHRTVAITPSKYLPFLTDNASGYRYMYENSCFGSMQGDCLRGNKNSIKTPILVIGDSHAAQLARFFDVVAEKDNAAVRLIASPSCATIPGLDKASIGRGSDKQCASQTDEVKKYIPGSNPIFIAASWDGFGDQSLQQVKQFIKQETSNGKRVIVISEIPTLTFNPVRALHFSGIGIPKWTYWRDGSSALNSSPKIANSRIQHLFGNMPDYYFLDLTDSPIFGDAPYFDNDLMYFNHNHITEAASLTYGQQNADRLISVIETRNVRPAKAEIHINR